MLVSLLLAAPAASAALAVQPAIRDTPEQEIVVTATLQPVPEEEAPATITVIDEDRIDALGQPLTLDLLRQVPGVAVATTGPPGTQTQVRIRGAEANHSLLLIDGIRFNDPASGNEPRFELLSNEGVRRIELVRGPQSAIYGAEAIGGVVALYTNSAELGTNGSVLVEGGSNDFYRGAARVGLGEETRALGLYGGYQRSGGIDSVGQGGERDGYENATIGGSARVQVSEAVGLRMAGRYVLSVNEFDGSDPATFRRANTLDESHNRIGALRAALDFAPSGSGFSVSVGGVLLDSENDNRRGIARVNLTRGGRRAVDALATYGFSTGPIEHRLSLGADYEDESFTARDLGFRGATNQDRSRERSSVVGAWRVTVADRVTGDVAVRHDAFEGFEDATTVRASLLVDLFGSLSAVVSYGEGIARPTFFELFGFFPGSFIGNPALRPERSEGFEAGLRYRTERLNLTLTAYRQRLEEEIIGVFNSSTFRSSSANATGTSRRAGIEAEGEFRIDENVSVTASYSFLDTDEQSVSGGNLVREVRRPRHSGSIGLDGLWGPVQAGVNAAYVGARDDVDFDEFPAQRVTLEDYVLVEARLAYRVTEGLEAFVRVANALDEDYRDVVGYATQGRAAYAGLRLRFGE